MTTTQQGAAPTRGQRLLRVFGAVLRDPAAVIGLLVMVVFLFLAVFGPLIAPYGFNESIYTDARQAPSALHWFGTDNLARDVFSRVVYGARSVFVLAGTGTLVAVALGASLGLLAGYVGGWFDELLMRFFDSLLSLPALLLALLILGMLRSSFGESVSSIGKGLGVLIVLIVVYTPIVTRVVRSVVLAVKSRGYIEAARLQGESTARILFREILPSVLPALAVEAALRFSYAIFLTSSLGFLGVGVQPPNPDWGLMVSEARGNYFQTPWALWYPVGAISVIVIGANLLADGVKRVLQTRLEL